MSEHVEEFLSKSHEVPSARGDSGGVKKTALLAQQEEAARGNMYRFLSSVYLRPPQEDLLQHIMARDFLEELSFLFGGEAVAALKDFAATAATGHFDKDLASVKQEYMDLFAVPTGRYVTPFEDVYRGKMLAGKQERGPLLGERAIAVRRIYREAGAEMDRECKELPTHIGVELSFMSFLCEMEAAAIRNEEGDALQDQERKKATDSCRYRELQVRFLQEHLNTWFPQLSQAIRAKAKSHLYPGLAQLTEEFLARDTASLITQPDSERHMWAAPENLDEPTNTQMG